MKPENFGKNLKTVLDFLDVSQSKLAERAGLTQAAISQIVNGEREPSLGSAIKIAEATGCSLERLLK